MTLTKNSTLKTLAIIAGVFLSPPAFAQSLFSPIIEVNDTVITYYELDQRRKFLEALKFPGTPEKLARQQLIEDRLKQGAAKQLGITAPEAEIIEAMERFAARANLSAEEFSIELEKIGISSSTFREFIQMEILWRDVIRARFGAKTQISETQLERSVNAEKSGTSIEILLTEIILPMRTGQEEETQELANDLAQIRSIQAFSDAAREYSAAPTRDLGGLIKWQKLDELPPIVQPLVFGLAPGQVTEPLTIPNALALFQLRDIRETKYNQPRAHAIDYAIYKFPTSDVKMTEQFTQGLDHCDTLYAFAKNNPDHAHERTTSPLNEIPLNIKGALANLDDNEFIMTRVGDMQNVIALCNRSLSLEIEQADLAQIQIGLRNKRLESYARGYLENLRDDARIVER